MMVSVRDLATCISSLREPGADGKAVDVMESNDDPYSPSRAQLSSLG